MLKRFLILFIFLIFVQIAIGGITRLTESGLSITEWDFLSGVIPPTDNGSWNTLFNEYKETPQYSKINSGMTLPEFKVIFFWEYFHRLFGRLVGFVALFFVLFCFLRRRHDRYGPVWLYRSMFLVFLIGVVGAFGWIMVATGLKDRPWVNAYYLSLHLSLAVGVLSYVLWLYVQRLREENKFIGTSGYSIIGFIFFFLVVFVQLFLGGMISGMRAALFYPTFPLMNGKWIPTVLTDTSFWNWTNVIIYDGTVFLPTLALFVHRILPIGIILFFGWIVYRIWKMNDRLLPTKWSSLIYLFSFSLALQIALGIITLVLSKGQVPVVLGVLHQFVGVFILCQAVTFVYLERYLSKR